MKRNAAIYLTAAISILAASSISAHHSHPAFYDACKKVSVSGKVESVTWKNPHVLVVVKLDDGSSYTAEWTSLQGLTNHGVADAAQAALIPGTRIAVSGNPMRDPAQIRATFPNIDEIKNTKVLDLMQIRRTDGSWSWEQEFPPCR